MSRKTKGVFGTKEWAEKTANCLSGCSHDCRYCYAKTMALRFGRKTRENWRVEEPDLSQVRRVCKGKPCKVMFPSTHDITPASLDICMDALGMLIGFGHKVLVVSKPHVCCIREICSRFADMKEGILFRFTIGSTDDGTLSLWEPGAPCFGERLESLKLAREAGFETSVSCEPMLDDKVRRVVDTVTPYTTQSIWIGKMNQLRQRLSINGKDADIVEKAECLIASQNDDRIRAIHADLANHPLVRWKESIKKVLGMEIPTTAGLDV